MLPPLQRILTQSHKSGCSQNPYVPGCRHETLEYVGDQKTDDGVNSYKRCRNCGMLFVMTPSGKLVGIPGVKPGQSEQGKKKGNL